MTTNMTRHSSCNWKCATCGSKFTDYDVYETHQSSCGRKKPSKKMLGFTMPEKRDQEIDAGVKPLVEWDSITFLERAPRVITVRRAPSIPIDLQPYSCDECHGNVAIDAKTGDFICKKCGLVVSRVGFLERESLQRRKEWMATYYDNPEHRT